MNDLDYETQKRLAQSQDAADRRRIAEREDVRPELLYFLAEDNVAEVRRAIAANASTPGQANVKLARDTDLDVRGQLAQKIARILPDLKPDEASRVHEHAIQTIEILAQDEIAQVRAILAEELKSSPHVPHDVVMRLARDVEVIVAAPVLQYSPLLSDDDLREIVATAKTSGALSAIASRTGLSSSVSDAVVATRDVNAVASLLANGSAQIREETLDLILDEAPGVEAWHEPLVKRPSLPPSAARRIAGFVASSLIDMLVARNDLGREVQEELKTAVKRRLEKKDEPADAKDEEDKAAAPKKEKVPAAKRVAALIKAGKLDDEAVQEAAGRGDKPFVIEALAQSARVSADVMRKAIESHSAKGITAVTWRAGFSMRTAMMIQRSVGQVPTAKLLNARGGTDYPIDPREIKEQLKLYGINS